MATPLPLEGDGLVENLFHYLWSTDDLGAGPRVGVPPTVIFRASQPVAWYFTSRRSGRIKRKHRANLTPAHIEHSFTKRKATTDIVAYYLYLPHPESASPAIEYFDPETLREFLFKRPEIPSASPSASSQGSGILQQFALPKGARNATMRAIWSPKLCLLERRVNLRKVHDARFSVYERGVTFEEGGGAEALSRADPVRGAMLPGMVQQLCEQVVDHVTRVSYHKFRIARMVLRLQADADDRLWLLWCSSLRLHPPLTAAITAMAPGVASFEAGIRPLDIVGDVKVPAFAFAQDAGGPVSLSSSNISRDEEEPRPGQARCASCAHVVARRALLSTTYKAVLAHFQHVLRFLRERVNETDQASFEWPPDDRVIQQAGGVGFGILGHLKSFTRGDGLGGAGKKVWRGREMLVPPVIRYLHPTLNAEDFARHRQDPIFLHKTVAVCERCCLVYADYATAALEANALGIRSSASAPALLRPVREQSELRERLDEDPTDVLRLATTNHHSPLGQSTRGATSKTKPPTSAWQPMPTDEQQRKRQLKYKAGPRSTLDSLPVAPKMPPRIEGFEPEDNDALRIPDGLGNRDGTPQHLPQQREEAFFQELYQQKDTSKRGGHALRHILEAADRLSKAKPQHRLAALDGGGDRIGHSRSTGALAEAVSELKLARKPGKSPYCFVQRLRGPCDSNEGSGIALRSPGGVQSPSVRNPQQQQGKAALPKKTHKKAMKGKAPEEGGVAGKGARFVSSRENRAAAEHRDFLVAALSDAQVQSLATLITSTRETEARQEQHEAREEEAYRGQGVDKDEHDAQSPQEQEDLQQEQEAHEDPDRHEEDDEKQTDQMWHEGHLDEAEEQEEYEGEDEDQEQQVQEQQDDHELLEHHQFEQYNEQDCQQQPTDAGDAMDQELPSQELGSEQEEEELQPLGEGCGPAKKEDQEQAKEGQTEQQHFWGEGEDQEQELQQAEEPFETENFPTQDQEEMRMENLLEEARELITTATASSESHDAVEDDRDEQQVAPDHDSSVEVDAVKDQPDTASTPLEFAGSEGNDSASDVATTAEAAVAASIPLPPSNDPEDTVSGE
ncbi:hypothetical protein BBJ28_00018540 [Nothophytophthora sp. Chile5]|nr:hypothetical protein BBJ28_00018540 [Nothophytophthora sp. Chile5]